MRCSDYTEWCAIPAEAHPRCHIPRPHRHMVVCMIDVEEYALNCGRRLRIRWCRADYVFQLPVTPDTRSLKNPPAGLKAQIIKRTTKYYAVLIDPIAEKIKVALSSLVHDKAFRLGSKGYNIKRSKGKGASGFTVSKVE